MVSYRLRIGVWMMLAGLVLTVAFDQASWTAIPVGVGTVFIAIGIGGK